jgi:hypothetical protein
MSTRGHILTALLAAALSLGGPAAARADVVICTDNSRHEGEVVEKGDLVIVKTRRGVVRLERAKVADILRTETSLADRFRADPNARDLLILASRAGIALTLEHAELLVMKLRTGEDATVGAELLLDALRLTPEHTRAIVERHVSEFKEEFGAKAAVYEGEHYVVLTTLGGSWARKVGLRMDGIFKEFQKRLIFKEKITDRFVVKLYASEIEYADHDGPPRTSAYFCSGTRELVAFRQRTDDLLFEGFYHEGMHQFLHFYVPNPPIWFDEGLAQYFETARPGTASSGGKPSYIVGGANRWTASFLKRRLEGCRTVPLRRLVSMDYEEFCGDRDGVNYAHAWAFTHFLVESKNRTLNQLWLDYFFALRDGADQEEANKKVFGKVDLPQLQGMLEKYIRRLK